MSLEGLEEQTGHSETMQRLTMPEAIIPAEPEGQMVEAVSPELRIYNPPWSGQLPTRVGTPGKPQILTAERRADRLPFSLSLLSNLLKGSLLTSWWRRLAMQFIEVTPCDTEQIRGKVRNGSECNKYKIPHHHAVVYFLLFLHMNSEPPSGRDHALHIRMSSTPRTISSPGSLWIITARRRKRMRRRGRGRRLQQLWINICDNTFE